MKSKRQMRVLEIIHQHSVHTQEELLRLLQQDGFRVTQATISRDIKELRLIKTPDGEGGYRYSTVQQENEDVSSKLHTLFADAVVQLDCAGNVVVVKCLSGMANAVCAAIDAQQRPDIVGTISGDDTFLCIVRDENTAIRLVNELKSLLQN